MKGIWTALLSLALPVTAQTVSVTPDSGTGASHTFTATYTDSFGAQDIWRAGMLFNTYVSGVNACYVADYQTTGADKGVYLISDSGSTLLGPFTGAPLSNSSCTVTAATAQTSGNTLTLTVGLTFATTFQKDANTYLDIASYKQPSVAWAEGGSWSTYCHTCSEPPQYTVDGPYLADPATWGGCPDYSTGYTFDSQGILLSDENGTLVYNPDSIEQYGLHEWGCYRSTGSAQALKATNAVAHWLLANQDASGRWPYTFNYPVPPLPTLEAPWGSAMAQGQGMSFLVRMYETTGNSAYLTAAENALGPLQVAVASGGLVDSFQGHPFYVEYPTTPPNFVLNGFMFTLIGLYDLSQYSSTAQELFNQGMQTLDFAIPYYDLGDLSAYNLVHLTMSPRSVAASAVYHKIHVEELRMLKTVVPEDKIVAFYANLWCNYAANLN